MNIRELKQFLRTLVEETFSRAVLLFGPPGIGKSQAVQQVAREHSLGFIDLRLAQCDPTDLRGVLVFDPQQKLGRWFVSSSLPDPARHGERGILFLDEINLAPPSVQAAGYQLILDRKVGDYALPPGWIVVAAGNRLEDRANIYKLPAPLANRFIHVDVTADLDDWKAWAYANEIHPAVIAFLNFKPDLFCKVPEQIKEDIFPTPRTWHFASDLLKTVKDKKLLDASIQGAVGEGAGIEFSAFASLDAESRGILDAILGGESRRAPELSLQFLVNSYLIQQLKKNGSVGGRVVQYSLVLEPEHAVVLLRDALKIDAGLQQHPAWPEAAGKFGRFVL